MGLEAVRVISQWAGAVAVLALGGCFIAATAAVELARGMLETADDAFRLARLMAVVGGSCVILAGLTSTFYWWRLGIASGNAAIGIGLALSLAAVAFAVAARRFSRRV